MKPLPFDRNVIAVKATAERIAPVEAVALEPSVRRQHQGAAGRAGVNRGAPIPHTSPPRTAEQLLWLAVLVQALDDALGQVVAVSRPEHKAVLRNEAINWFRGNGRDFQDVCLSAGLDPAAVRERALKLINGAPMPRRRRQRKPHPARQSAFMRRLSGSTALVSLGLLGKRADGRKRDTPAFP